MVSAVRLLDGIKGCLLFCYAKGYPRLKREVVLRQESPNNRFYLIGNKTRERGEAFQSSCTLSYHLFKVVLYMDGNPCTGSVLTYTR